jgi:hypothetical protein
VGKLARKIIDAAQNSLVPSLLARLFWPTGYLVWIVCRDLGPQPVAVEVFAGVFVLAIVAVSGAWILGHLANHAPVAEGPLQRLQSPPSNGFEAWSIPPAGGLNPPRPMRALVERLGAPEGSRRAPALAVFALMTVFLLAALLALLEPDTWGRLHPALADREVRLGVAVVLILILYVADIRRWASLQRARIEGRDVASDQPPASRHGDAIGIGVLLLLLVVFALAVFFY